MIWSAKEGVMMSERNGQSELRYLLDNVDFAITRAAKSFEDLATRINLVRSAVLDVQRGLDALEERAGVAKRA